MAARPAISPRSISSVRWSPPSQSSAASSSAPSRAPDRPRRTSGDGCWRSGHARRLASQRLLGSPRCQSDKFDHHTDNASEERMKRIMAMYPLGRVGRPADVPPLVLLLASPMASWITGLVVSINGGYSMV
ncbi:MAG: SDR family oxidoreductase [Actinomycetia bacterium]|nr:SDR family oxidoreductase [Actinomycetes bacterium]